MDTARIKVGGYAVVSIGLAYMCGYLLSAVIAGGAGFSALLLAVAAVLWLAVLTLISVSVENRYAAAALLAATALMLWVTAASRGSVLVFAGTGAFFLLAYAGYYRSRTDVDNGLKIKFARSAMPALSSAMTGLILFATLAVFAAEGAGTSNALQGALNAAVESAAPLIRGFLPGFAARESIDTVLKNLVTEKLPAGTPGAAIDQTFREFKKSIEQTIGLPLAGSKSIADAVYGALREKFAALGQTAKSAALALGAVILFMTLKGVAFFANWIIIACAYGLYAALTFAGFFKIKVESADKEVITL